MIYVDTSLVIAALTPETATVGVQQWLASQDGGTLCVSGWVSTEVSSALAIKVRAKDLSVEQRAEVLALWHRMLVDNLHVAAIPGRAYALAASFVDRHDLGLRAGDALHLAIASLGGHSLATLDLKLAKAAPQVGVPVVAV